MARFGFVGGAYQAPSFAADAQVCINWFPENNESGQGKSAASLLPTPGLSVFSTLSGPSVPGCIEIDGRTFWVSGNNLYEVFIDGTKNVLNVGNPLNQWALPPSLAASAQQLLVASGGQGYVFNLQTGVFTGPISAIGGVVQVGYSDGYFAAFLMNTQELLISTLLDATTWPGLQTALVSVFPGFVRGIIVEHRELCVLGDRQSQCYYDSGNQFPYDVIPGGFMEMGLMSSFCWSRLDNTFFWWGQDERGARVAWRMNNYSPVRVSHHGIEEVVKQFTTVADAFSWSYQDGGHTFWLTSFPTAARTLVFDVATGLWHERGYFSNGVYSAHLGACHLYAFGKHLIGDRQSGNIYEMKSPTLVNGAWTFGDDAGQAIRRERRSPYVDQESKWIFFDEFELEAEAGVGNNPGGGVPIGPTALTIAGNKGGLWNITVSDVTNQISITKTAVGPANVIIVQDSVTPNTAWQFSVDETVPGQERLIAVGVAFGAQYPISYPMATTPGNLQTAIFIAANEYTISNPIPVPRAPVAALSWSDDRAKTWSNERQISLGNVGEYGKKIRVRRLGRAWGTKGRVFKLVYTDSIPFRIIDAHVKAKPELGPTPRLVSEVRKGA